MADSEQAYADATTAAMASNELLLARSQPNFPRAPLPIIHNQQTPAIAERIDPNTGSLHYMTKLALTQAQLRQITNMPFLASYNMLCRLPMKYDTAGHAVWYVQSIADGAPLHCDYVDAEVNVLSGRKVWVTVRWQEAMAAGIDVVDVRSKRPSHTWAQFLQCPSFRWFIVEAGDSLFMPADRLHGTHALGVEMARSTGHYLATLPSLPHTLAHWLLAPEWMPEDEDLRAMLQLFVSQLDRADTRTRQLIHQACDLAALCALQVPLDNKLRALVDSIVSVCSQHSQQQSSSHRLGYVHVQITVRARQECVCRLKPG
jgi:hypothetical protein